VWPANAVETWADRKLPTARHFSDLCCAFTSRARPLAQWAGMAPYDQLGVYKRGRGLMHADAARVQPSLCCHGRSMGGRMLSKNARPLCQESTTFAVLEVAMRALCPDKGAGSRRGTGQRRARGAVSILWIAYRSHREARCIPGPAVHGSRLPSAVYDARAGHEPPQIVCEAARTWSDVRANTVGAYHGFPGTSVDREGIRGATSDSHARRTTRKGGRGSPKPSPRGGRSVRTTCSVGVVDHGPEHPARCTGTLGRQVNWTKVSECRTRPLQMAWCTAPSRLRGCADSRAARLRLRFQATVGRPIPFFAARATGLGLEATEIITIFDIENGDAFTRSWRFCPSYKPIKAAAKSQFPTGRKLAKKIFIEFPTGRKSGKNRIDI
jgi:hypothetical protein